LRGCAPDLIFEHYRKRAKDDERFPEIAGRFDCKLTPSSTIRENGTVQSATATFKRDVAEYCNDYYLVDRHDLPNRSRSERRG
ncbi:hypothetical protein ACC736_38855, partial [Rhizobium ruizarguesonis]